MLSIVIKCIKLGLSENVYKLSTLQAIAIIVYVLPKMLEILANLKEILMVWVGIHKTSYANS